MCSPLLLRVSEWRNLAPAWFILNPTAGRPLSSEDQKAFVRSLEGKRSIYELLKQPAFAEIDLMFSHIDQNLAGIDFPEDNFVFDDNPFKSLLRDFLTQAEPSPEAEPPA